MRRLVYLFKAQRDLWEIGDWLAQRGVSLKTAERFMDRLRAKCRQLAENPATLGRVRDDLGLALRSFPFKGFVIFFRYEEQKFTVVRIVRGVRDLTALFDNGDEDAKE